MPKIDRRQQAVVHAQQHPDPDDQLAFWAGFACALLLTFDLSDPQFKTAADMGHEAVKRMNQPRSIAETVQS